MLILILKSSRFLSADESFFENLRYRKHHADCLQFVRAIDQSQRRVSLNHYTRKLFQFWYQCCLQMHRVELFTIECSWLSRSCDWSHVKQSKLLSHSCSKECFLPEAHFLDIFFHRTWTYEFFLEELLSPLLFWHWWITLPFQSEFNVVHDGLYGSSLKPRSFWSVCYQLLPLNWFQCWLWLQRARHHTKLL